NQLNTMSLTANQSCSVSMTCPSLMRTSHMMRRLSSRPMVTLPTHPPEPKLRQHPVSSVRTSMPGTASVCAAGVESASLALEFPEGRKTGNACSGSLRRLGPVEELGCGVHDRLLGGRGPGQFGGEAALAEDEDPVGDGQQLGQLARGHDDRH